MSIKLEKYNGQKTRFTCPNCGHVKSFSKYINIETGEYLNDLTGRCNREISCGYHKKPIDYLRNTNRQPKEFIQKPDILNTSFIPLNIYNESLYGNKNIEELVKKNSLVQFLLNLFSEKIIYDLLEKYKIGYSKFWDGSTVFWQIDINERIRTGKIILYDYKTGNRIKKTFSHINWIHRVNKFKNFNLRQCLFGEHLLKDKSKIVCVVESEKTAIISSVYMPQYLWLATGGLSNLNQERIKVLYDRKVIFFPDLGAYNKWELKVQSFNQNYNFKVSKFLELNYLSLDLKSGDDLADCLIKENLNSVVI